MDSVKKVIEIGEELRITRDKTTKKPAYGYIYNKHKNDGIFVSFDHFLRVMQVYAVFWASRDEETIRDRKETEYKFI